MAEIVTELTIDASGAQEGARAYVSSMDLAEAAGDRVVNQMRALEGAVTNQVGTMTRVAGSTSNAARSFDRLRNSVDPAARAQSNLERAQRTLDRAVAQGITTQDEANRVLDLARQKYDATGREADEYGRNTRGASSATSTMTRQARQLVGVLASLGLALGVRQIVEYADAWTNAGNRIAAVGNTTAEEADRIRGALTDLAVETRSSFDATLTLFSRLQVANDSLGASEDDLLTVVRTVNEAMTISGASAAEAEGAIRQLGQALGSGALRGDELNSILEQAPILARAVAEEMSVSITQLRELGAEGAITAETVFNALLGSSEAIHESFATTQTTVGQAMTNLETRFIEFVGGADSATGASRTLAKAIGWIGENIGPVITALGVLAGVMVTTFVVGRVNAFAEALQGLPATLARVRTGFAFLMTNPFGIAITAIATIAGGLLLWKSRTDEASFSLEQHEEMVQGVRAAYEAAGGAVDDWASRIEDVTLSRAIVDLRSRVEELDAATQQVGFRWLRPTAEQEGITQTIEAMRDLLATGDFKLQDFNAAIDAFVQAGHFSAEAGAEIQQSAEALEVARQKADEARAVFDYLRGEITATELATRLFGDTLRATGPAATGAARGINAAGSAAQQSIADFLGAANAVQAFASALRGLDGIAAPELSDMDQVGQFVGQGGVAIGAGLLQSMGPLGVDLSQVGAAMDAWVELRTTAEQAVSRVVQRESAVRADLIEGVEMQAYLNALDGEDRAIAALTVRYQGYIDQLNASAQAQGLAAASQADINELMAAYNVELAALQASTGGFSAGGGGGTATSAANAAAELIAALQFELSLLSMTQTEQAIANNLRIAGAEATDEQRAQIIALTTAIEDAGEAAENTTGKIGDFAIDLAQILIGAKSPLDALEKAVANLSQRAFSFASQQFQAGNVGGGVLGLVGGVILGIIGNIIRRRRELQQAKDAWAAMSEQVADFGAKLRGESGGSLVSALSSARQEMEQYIAAAEKAQASTAGLAAMMDVFVARQLRQFGDTFGVMMAALDEGLGNNSPAVTAAQNVLSIGEALRGFVADTRKAVGLGGMDQTAIDAAREAAASYALSLLGTAPELSAVEEELHRIQGTSVHLQALLEDLGMSAEEAGQAVADGVTAALDRVRDQFGEDLATRLNDARGKGYLNDIADLIAGRADLLSDANLLGIGSNSIGEIFALEAQAIVDGARLVGESFDDLITIFPELAGVVQESAEAVSEAMDRINDAASNILGFLRDRLAGSGSTLSPADRLAAAQQMFDQQLGLAQSGDVAAQAGISGFAGDLLDAARDVFASSPAFQQIFGNVTTALLNLPSVAGLSDPALAGLRDQVGSILGFAQGGLIGNGVWNVDSVRAGYADGGAVMLAGGEFVTRAPSVNPATYATLDHINRTGRPPSNDNANRQNFADLMRVVQSGTNASVLELRTGLSDLGDRLESRLQRLERAVKDGPSKRSPRKVA